MTSILMLCKKNDERAKLAAEYTKLHFPETEVIYAARDTSLPDEMWWKGDYLISYLCPWVIPPSLLQGAQIAAINFHPGPPEYPGIGCTNFAIYDGAKTFGVTCHIMAPRVDSGALIAIRRFPVHEKDTVLSITQKCHASISVLFYEIMDLIIQGKPLPKLYTQWAREAYTRKELNELCRCAPEMSEAEIQRRVKAVTYPGAPGAYMEIAGQKFSFECAL